MREENKNRIAGIVSGACILLLCIAILFFVTQIYRMHKQTASTEIVLDPNQSFEIRSIVPQARFYILSTIVEESITSEDLDVSSIVSLHGLHHASRHEIDRAMALDVDCKDLMNVFRYSNLIVKYSMESPELLPRLREQSEACLETRLEYDEESPFALILTEKCSYYLDFKRYLDFDRYPGDRIRMLMQELTLTDIADERFLRADCMTQNVQFITLNEEVWAEKLNERTLDKIKQGLDMRIREHFAAKHRTHAVESLRRGLTHLFCGIPEVGSVAVFAHDRDPAVTATPCGDL